jgi:4-oxalocrotonate tautomerase
VAIIQCDIRRGRSDDQKRRLAAGLTEAVSEATGEPIERLFLVIREMPASTSSTPASTWRTT